MRIGWLADAPTYVGGAELTQAEFRAASPLGVEIIDCPPGAVVEGLDAYAIHNCVTYTLEDLAALVDKSNVKYWNDVGPHMHPGVREWIEDWAMQVCCSPVQADYMGLQPPARALVPPPVDLARFTRAAEAMNGNRAGVVSVGSWRNYGKAPHRASEWAGGDIDFYGGGPFAPTGSREVAYDQMPELLARYQTFVFLPTVIEPFGRLVAEAWAAGCEVVTNSLVGAGYWIQEAPEKIESAAEDFWKLVLA